MWIWDFQLRELGFRQKDKRYWQCEGAYGLSNGDHLSLFLWSQQALGHSISGPQVAYELTEFHITFLLGQHHVHFYYHEFQENHWEPGGYTAATQIRKLGYDPSDLKAEADQVAEALSSDLNGTWIPRAD